MSEFKVIGEGSNGLVGASVKTRTPNECIKICKTMKASQGFVTDHLLQDALMIMAIQELPSYVLNSVEKESFVTSSPVDPQYYCSYQVKRVIMNTAANTFTLDDVTNTNSKSTPESRCLITYGIQRPIPLYEVFYRLSLLKSPDHQEIANQMFTKFNAFLASCLKFAQKTGFSHGDVHLGNVLYDVKHERIVLIDYGRAFIPPEFMPQHLRQLNPSLPVADDDAYRDMKRDEIDTMTPKFLNMGSTSELLYRPYKIETANGAKNQFYFVNNYTKDVYIDPKTFQNNPGDLLEARQFMMALDIGSMCMMIYSQYYVRDDPSNFIRMRYPHLTDLIFFQLNPNIPGNARYEQIEYVWIDKLRVARYATARGERDTFEYGLFKFAEFLMLVAEGNKSIFVDSEDPAKVIIKWRAFIDNGIIASTSFVISPSAAKEYYDYRFKGGSLAGGFRKLKPKLRKQRQVIMGGTSNESNIATNKDRQMTPLAHFITKLVPAQAQTWESVYKVKQALGTKFATREPSSRLRFSQPMYIYPTETINSKSQSQEKNLIKAPVLIPDIKEPIPVVGGKKGVVNKPPLFVLYKNHKKPYRVHETESRKRFIKVRGKVLMLSDVRGVYKKVQ